MPFNARIAVFMLSAVVVAACASDKSPSTPTDPNGTGTTANGTTITADNGSDNQVALAGAPIQVSLHVKSATGAPVPNDTVTWNVAGGGGTLSSPTSITDANGAAVVTWTLGKVAGDNTLGANIPGAAVAIKATGTVGPLAALMKLSPDSQTVSATGSVLLTVRTADQYGNVIGKIPVFWSTTGGKVSPDSASTGTSGNGEAVFTAPTGVARYVITATTAGLPAVSFIVKTF